MVKAVALLLVFLAALAVFGRLRFGGRGRGGPVEARCRACGRPLPGKPPCSCGGSLR